MRLTYHCFAARRDGGTDQVVQELLRCQVLAKARRSEGTALAGRLPARTSAPDLPETPDRPRVLAEFIEATGRPPGP